jgi:hypothetical protein
MSEPRLREQITQVTNRNEAFHGFADWLMINNPQSSLRSLQAVQAQDLGFPRFGGAGFTIERFPGTRPDRSRSPLLAGGDCLKNVLRSRSV